MSSADTLADLTIAEIGLARLHELRDLWLALHHHHAQIGSRPLVQDETVAWERRRARYEDWLRAGEAFVLVAERAGQPLGYAVVHIEHGHDDTYPLAEQWAEIYSLSVDPAARGAGIGTKLLDAIDERLAARGIRDVAVGAMVENEAAIRLYQRRGFTPREVYLYRFGGAE